MKTTHLSIEIEKGDTLVVNLPDGKSVNLWLNAEGVPLFIYSNGDEDFGFHLGKKLKKHELV